MDEPQEASDGERPDRLQLARDVLVFQGKLALDGLLDFLLIPVSLAAAVVSFFERDEERDAFYRVVAAGERADRWINLFGVVGRSHGPQAEEEARVDDVVDRIEAYLKREYDEGRLPARSAIDAALKRLRRDTDDEAGRA